MTPPAMSELAFKTLFAKELNRMGLSKSRNSSIHNAIRDLHRALCELDYNNMELIGLCGLENLLSKYAKIEEVRDVMTEIQELGQVQTVDRQFLPTLLGRVKSERAKEILRERLTHKEQSQ